LGIPHETEGASVVLFFQYIRALSQAGYSIYHLVLLEGPNWPEDAVSNYINKMQKPGMFKVAIVRARAFVQSTRYAQRLAYDQLSASLGPAQAFRPDLVIAFDILPAWVTTEIKAPNRITWLGDLHFQSFWWHAIYAIKENLRTIRQLPAIWLTCRGWKNVYREVLPKADQVIVSSASSVGHLLRMGINSDYEPYPWPVAQIEAEICPSDQPRFVFFGNLVGLGSRSALHFLIEKLYPRLRKYWGSCGFSIILAGRGKLPEWFAKLASDKPEIKFVGFIESMADLLAGSHAVLVPISVPVGNRSRILTAMANGALVIAHKAASLGNSALVDGQTCYLANTADEFVERMRLAVEDRGAVRDIIDRARASYDNLFRSEVASRKLVDRVNRLLKQK
jgi:glycosyltransferase involved in cell wall biosynthesis